LNSADGNATEKEFHGVIATDNCQSGNHRLLRDIVTVAVVAVLT